MSIYFHKICKKAVEAVNGDGADYLKTFPGKSHCQSDPLLDFPLHEKKLVHLKFLGKIITCC